MSKNIHPSRQVVKSLSKFAATLGGKKLRDPVGPVPIPAWIFLSSNEADEFMDKALDNRNLSVKKQPHKGKWAVEVSKRYVAEDLIDQVVNGEDPKDLLEKISAYDPRYPQNREVTPARELPYVSPREDRGLGEATNDKCSNYSGRSGGQCSTGCKAHKINKGDACPWDDDWSSAESECKCYKSK